ncbi:helix-turn-helix domain-containing protein [Streptomyces sp. NRRL F-5123]|uniref:helix-turn-helix domain-containing protein n=1 Tax=Streptomyces sp. NRRL F-5123 TaxID=1463856 RepID=UPI00131BCE9B|nr:helix-turn-helix domain-containing protein [Streptomyces sp. NRRL F-5123]
MHATDGLATRVAQAEEPYVDWAELARVAPNAQDGNADRLVILAGLKRAWEDGALVSDLAARTGRSRRWVYRWLRAAGVEVRKGITLEEREQRAARCQYVREHRDEIITKYAGGAAVLKLVKEYGVTLEFMTAQFSEWGQPMRSAREAARLQGTKMVLRN